MMIRNAGDVCADFDSCTNAIHAPTPFPLGLLGASPGRNAVLARSLVATSELAVPRKAAASYGGHRRSRRPSPTTDWSIRAQAPRAEDASEPGPSGCWRCLHTNPLNDRQSGNSPRTLGDALMDHRDVEVAPG